MTRVHFQLLEANPTPPNELIPGCSASDFDHFDPKIRQFIAAAIAPNTRRAYAGDVGHFVAWGGSIPATPETIARYLADHAQRLSTATLARRLAAIGRAHTIARERNPAASDLVRITLRGIRRTYGRPQDRVAALTKEHLIAITSSLGNSTRDVRDRALLLIGFGHARHPKRAARLPADNTRFSDAEFADGHQPRCRGTLRLQRLALSCL